MKPVFKWVIGIGAAALAYGTYRWWKNYNFASKIDYKLAGKSFRISGLRSGSYNFDLVVTNKFGVSANITGYNLSILLNGQEISQLSSDAVQPLPNNIPSKFSLSGTFDPLNSFKTIAKVQNIISALTRPETVLITATGTMGVSVKGISVKNIPVDFTMSLKDFLPANS